MKRKDRDGIRRGEFLKGGISISGRVATTLCGERGRGKGLIAP